MRFLLPSLVAACSVAATLEAQVDPALLAGLEARSIGPAGMSGRVAAVCGVASDPNILWVGAATGGVWKSVNGGLTWKPVFDDQPVASIGAVAVNQQHPDIVWVGTGEGNPRNSASVGNGVYRTTDGGKTWTHLGLASSERIHRIRLHPGDPGVAWVGCMGKAWGDSAERGVYKTVDGGRSWTRVLFVDERTGCCDLEQDPQNPDKLIAAMWQYRRRPWFFESGGPGSGLWVTSDGGDHWRRATAADGMPEGDLGRIGLAVARSKPTIVYALVEAKKSALLRSADGGRTFETVNSSHDIAQRPFYFGDIRVDPADPNRIYNLHGLVTLSEDGGRSFKTLIPWSAVHPDHHAMWIDPGDPNRILEGNDGGVAISTDRGRSWRFARNLPLAQYYHISVDMDRPYHVYGGMQDNGSWRGPSAVWENGGIRNLHWQELFFGDGFGAIADPRDPMVGYAMSQGGYLGRWNLRTGERKQIRPDAPDGIDLRFNWNAGLAIDPFDPARIYYGSQFVHVSADRGDTWSILGGDLTTNNRQWQKQDRSGGLTPDVTAAENYCSILTIAPSPVREGVIWAGTDDGRVQVTRDAGKTWQSVEQAIPDLPVHTWCPHIEASKFDAATAFAVFDNHRRSDWTPYVYVTRDFGKTWTSLATGELRGYVHVLEQDPVAADLLFAGTEFGLFVSKSGGKSWFRWKHGLPRVAVRALVVHPREHDLVIATHGRGAFILDDIRPLRALDAATAAQPFHLFPVGDAQQYRVAQSRGPRFPGIAEFRGKTRAYGAFVDLWIGAADVPLPGAAPEKPKADVAEASAKPGAGRKNEVRIEVFDRAGHRLRKLRRPVVRGLNRIVWALRSDPPKLPPRPAGRSGPPRRGPEVVPGTYRVVARFRGHEATADVRVRPDPRVPVPRADRLAKWKAVQDAARLVETYTTAIERIDETRSDLATIEKKLQPRDPDRKDAGRAKLLATARELTRSLTAIEKQFRTPPRTQGILSRDRIGNRILAVYESLQSSWDAPTRAQRTYLRQARDGLGAGLRQVDAFFAGDLARFRDEIRAAKVELLPDLPPLEAGKQPRGKKGV